MERGIGEVKTLENGKCKGCDVNLFCHSCINFTLGMQSDEEIFQKFCEKQKGHLEKLLWGN